MMYVQGYPVGGEKQLPLQSPLLTTVMRDQLPLLTFDIHEENNGRKFADSETLTAKGIHQVFNFPIVSQGKTLGCLNFCGGYNQWTADQAMKMKALADGKATKAFELYFAGEELIETRHM